MLQTASVQSMTAVDAYQSSAIELHHCRAGDKYTFTIDEGANGQDGRISVNYDGFIDDVSVGDIMLVDGGLSTFKILTKTQRDVVMEVVDGGKMTSRCAEATVIPGKSVLVLLYWHGSRLTPQMPAEPCTDLIRPMYPGDCCCKAERAPCLMDRLGFFDSGGT